MTLISEKCWKLGIKSEKLKAISQIRQLLNIFSVSGYESFYNSPIPFTIAMLLLPNIPHYFLAYCFRHKQNNDLKRTTMSMTTLRMHSTLRKVSTMKAFLPLFLLADVLIYFFCQLELLPPQFIEYFLGGFNIIFKHSFHEHNLFWSNRHYLGLDLVGLTTGRLLYFLL